MPRAFACRIRVSRFLIITTALLMARMCPAQIQDLHGNRVEPLQDRGKVHVLLFVRTDCPITNRYAPELRRIANEFAQSPVEFFLVYSGAVETPPAVEEHIRQYRFPGTAILDPKHELAGRAHATVAPEAAVFDRSGKLLYLGRIDDRWISFGRSRPEPTVHDLEAAIKTVLAGNIPSGGKNPRHRLLARRCSLDQPTRPC